MVTSGPSTFATSYRYDTRGFLDHATSAGVAGVPASETFSHDAAGRVTTAGENTFSY